MFDEVKAMLVEILSIPEEKITEDAKLEADLGINSLELAEVAYKCEEQYGIEFKDEDIHTLITVGDVVKYIEENK